MRFTVDSISTVTAPPPYAQYLCSDDPDEVSAWARRRDGDHSRVVHGTGPYGFQAAVLEGRSLALAWARARLGQTIRGRFAQPCVQIPIDGTQEYAFGRQRFHLAPGTLAFMAPGSEVSRRGGVGALFALDIDATALISEVRARCPGVAQALPQRPHPVVLTEAARCELQAAIGSLAHALGPDAPAGQQLHCEGRLIAALADTLMVPTLAATSGRLSAQRFADLESWIDAHLAEPITVGRLCEAVQVGERTLQLAFQARRGMSPMRFVCERRLAAAHRRISDAAVDETITGIAASVGFTHLGRFALAYREAFGESPSKTWLRKRGPAVRQFRGVNVR